MCDIKIIGGAKPYRMRHDDLRTQRVRVELDMTVEDYIKLQRKVEGGTLLLEDKDEKKSGGDDSGSDIGSGEGTAGGRSEKAAGNPAGDAGASAPSAGGALANIIPADAPVEKIR
jgi:hypothetical protein